MVPIEANFRPHLDNPITRTGEYSIRFAVNRFACQELFGRALTRLEADDLEQMVCRHCRRLARDLHEPGTPLAQPAPARSGARTDAAANKK